MVTRIEKSSKLRNSQEYMLLWRIARDLGQGIVDRAINGDMAAIARIEKYAFYGRKKPAVVRWVHSQLKQIASPAKQAKKKAQTQ